MRLIELLGDQSQAASYAVPGSFAVATVVGDYLPTNRINVEIDGEPYYGVPKLAGTKVTIGETCLVAVFGSTMVVLGGLPPAPPLTFLDITVAGLDVEISYTKDTSGIAFVVDSGLTWDDGSPIEYLPGTDGDFTASHTYATAGSYTVGLTVVTIDSDIYSANQLVTVG